MGSTEPPVPQSSPGTSDPTAGTHRPHNHPSNGEHSPFGEAPASDSPAPEVSSWHRSQPRSTPRSPPRAPYRSVQEANAAQELRPRLAELSEEQAPDGLLLAQAAVVGLCKGQRGRATTMRCQRGLTPCPLAQPAQR